MKVKTVESKKIDAEKSGMVEPAKTADTSGAGTTEVTEPKKASTPSPELPIVPPEHRPPITGFARPPRHRKRLVLLLVVSLLIIAGAGTAGYVLLNRKPAKVSQVSVTSRKPAAKKPAAAPIDPLLARFTTPTTGETWLATPKKVGDLGYIDESDGSDVDYYQVGAHGQNIIYMSIAQELGSFTLLYEKAPDGTVRAVLQPNANGSYSSDYNNAAKESLTKKVIADTTIHYDSLTLPSSFSIGHNETVAPKYDGYLDVGNLITPQYGSGSTKTVLQTFGGSKLVRRETVYADTKLTSISYALDLPTGTELTLSYVPVDVDLSKFTWNNAVSVPAPSSADAADMYAVTRGCSLSNVSVTQDNAAQDSDFKIAGKSAGGQTVYTLANSNNPLVQKLYGEYRDAYADDPKTTVVSLNTFLNQHAIVAYKSSNNGWLVYVRTGYAEEGGCAKPVVYLYPTHAEKVSVQVGAQVTKSAPLYDPSKGWSAYAQPNGQLTVGGKSYGSLFWEGTGTGLYPAITSGTVVKRADALSTIKTQLKGQGLKPSEINDFVAYWQNKIPNQPYIRLTWFNTSEMNELAPLTVTPQPDTLIRVFLDMDGFTVPPKLPAQHLTSVPRKGFTVVEWGGLSQSALQ